jgi:hypothetical protein
MGAPRGSSPLDPYRPPGGGSGQPADSNGKHAPPPHDLLGLAERQNKENRPNTANAYGSTVTHTIGPDGRPQITQGFGGALAGANENLQSQFAEATRAPLDFGSAPALQYGEEARKAAVDAAYGQATSRLDPAWAAREDQERQRLANQGLDMNSEAFRNAMDQFSRGRNDAYTSALNMAIGRGGEDAGRMFDQSARAREMSIADMLRGRTQPLQEMLAMRGFLDQPSFNPSTGLAQAAGMQDDAAFQRAEAKRKEFVDLIRGLGSAIGDIIPG